MKTNVFNNSLLKALDPAIVARLDLQPVKFELMHEIEYQAARSSGFILSRRGWPR